MEASSAVVPMAAPQLRRWVELALIFAAAPGLMSLGPRWLVLPAILMGGGLSLALLLADPTFDRRRLIDATAARRGLARVLLRSLLVCAGLLLFTWLTRGSATLFRFPRTRPGLWLAVVVLYPIVSVYLQEVMYRTFFFHRYGALFRRPAAAIAVNALLFGWAHIIVHNYVALLLTTVGGLLFALTYLRSRSTLLVALEHAIYGDFVFSVGIGGMFVNATRLLSKVMS
jgi:uncharacterized protein